MEGVFIFRRLYILRAHFLWGVFRECKRVFSFMCFKVLACEQIVFIVIRFLSFGLSNVIPS